MKPLLTTPLLLLLALTTPAQTQTTPPPNILWITCEDISPDLGCYGVDLAVTPTLDRLAGEGVLYENAFALAGVCAVSRSSLITGMYSSSLGSHGMRSHTRLPQSVRCFTEYLREAGYHCTNNSKTDYNFPVPKNAWDECGNKAHWRSRKPNQPFFAVFNFTTTHESQIRCSDARYEAHTKRVPQHLRHDPAKVPVPPFHPDRPEVHRDWARYHDLITAMDLQVADVLRQLDEDQLARDTIVFFYSDHGAGMPRCKKWSYDSGTRVPLIVRFGKTWSHLSPQEPGTTTDRLVSFVDFAPTVLSLVDLPVPDVMQGRAFLGRSAVDPREHVFTIRDRMAERIDMVRGVRTKRFLYLRNYLPHLAFGRHCTYTQEMPTTQVWMQLAADDELTGPPALWFRSRKPLEELYDIQSDPHNIDNLADDPAHLDTLASLRAAHLDWLLRTRDLGFLPESDMLERAENSTPREVARDPARYPLEQIHATARLVGTGPDALPKLLTAITNEDPAVRFWAITGLGALVNPPPEVTPPLITALTDPSPVNRLAAAESLLHINSPHDILPTALPLLEHPSPWLRLRAATLLDMLGPAAAPAKPAIERAAKRSSQFGYENRLLGVLRGRLE